MHENKIVTVGPPESVTCSILSGLRKSHIVGTWIHVFRSSMFSLYCITMHNVALFYLMVCLTY